MKIQAQIAMSSSRDVPHHGLSCRWDRAPTTRGGKPTRYADHHCRSCASSRWHECALHAWLCWKPWMWSVWWRFWKVTSFEFDERSAWSYSFREAFDKTKSFMLKCCEAISRNYIWEAKFWALILQSPWCVWSGQAIFVPLFETWWASSVVVLEILMAFAPDRFLELIDRGRAWGSISSGLRPWTSRVEIGECRTWWWSWGSIG